MINIYECGQKKYPEKGLNIKKLWNPDKKEPVVYPYTTGIAFLVTPKLPLGGRSGKVWLMKEYFVPRVRQPKGPN